MARWIASIGAFVLLMTGVFAVSAAAEIASERDIAEAEGFTRDIASLEGTGEIVAAAATSSDQVFVPITPCRVADTRAAGGQMAADETRDFYITGSSGFETQGGTSGGCGVPANASAVEINITAPNAGGNGWMRVWPTDQSPPNATILSYTSVFSASNAGAVAICGSCGTHLSAKTYAYPTHVLLDVLGYYVDNVVPGYSVQAETLGVTSTWYGTDTAICPPGTTLIGGGAAGDKVGTFVGVSRPTGTGYDTWESWLETDDGVAKSWDQYTYAICAKTTR